MHPKEILRDEPRAEGPTFLERNQSPAEDLAFLRWQKNMDLKRSTRLVNKKWRLIYSMRYEKENP